MKLRRGILFLRGAKDPGYYSLAWLISYLINCICIAWYEDHPLYLVVSSLIIE
jgi:hypothetical protein